MCYVKRDSWLSEEYWKDRYYGRADPIPETAALSLLHHGHKRKKPQVVKEYKAAGAKALRKCRNSMAFVLNKHQTNVRGSPSTIVEHLRLCLLHHDWPAAAKCVRMLLSKSESLMPVIWKAILITVLNHPDSNTKCLKDFLRSCAGMNSTEEMVLFTAALFNLPEKLQTLSQESDEQDEFQIFNAS